MQQIMKCVHVGTVLYIILQVTYIKFMFNAIPINFVMTTLNIIKFTMLWVGT